MIDHRGNWPRSGRSVAAKRPSHLANTAVKGRPDYVRHRDLPRLIPLFPIELLTASPGEHAALVAKLKRALRIERQRGLAGHWTYDIARHRQLLDAHRAEVAALRLRVLADRRRRARWPT